MDMLLDSRCLHALIVSLDTVPAKHHDESSTFRLLARYIYVLQDPTSTACITTAWTGQYLSKLLCV